MQPHFILLKLCFVAPLLCVVALGADSEEANDKRIKQALQDTKISLELDSVQLAKAVDSLQVLGGIPIVVEPSVAAEKLDQTKFSVKLEKVGLTRALRTVLREAGPGLQHSVKRGV